jgi:uncharacterized membrane protein YfcA
MWFLAAISAVAVVAGGVAAVAGAGVGSILTPVLALSIDMRMAVLAVAAPHLIFNALRAWTSREHIDWKILKRFGVTSAAGSLAGALLHQVTSSAWITGIFAVLLMIAALFGITGWAERIRMGRRGAYAGGAISGFCGGLTGEQGGIRAAALLGFDLRKEAFVATATATAAVVDGVRLPIYLITRWGDMHEAIGPSVACTAGVVAGLFVGRRVLEKVPQRLFARVVCLVLLLIGALMIARLFLKK